MDSKKIDAFIASKHDYFPPEKIIYLKEKLASVDDEKFILISSVDLKDPVTILIISIFLGKFGVDRFILGDVGVGILKLLTFGCCGILTIIDWVNITKMTREYNFNKLMLLI